MPLHFLVVAQNAVIVGRIIEILNNIIIELLNPDLLIAVDIALHVFDDLEDYAAIKSELVVLFLGYYFIEFSENMGGLSDVVLVYAFDVQER